MERPFLKTLLLFSTFSPFVAHVPKKTKKESIYCNETIFGRNHVLCGTERYDLCEREVVQRNMHKSTKLFILHEYNTIRQEIALGNRFHGKDGPMPSAANMNMLVWSEELEFMAQRWANMCRTSDSPHFDDNRNTSYYYVNQLVSITEKHEVTIDAWLLAEITCGLSMYLWLSFVQMMPLEIIDSYRAPVLEHNEGMYHFFAQMVWAKTESIGCAFTLMKYENYTEFLVCNYGPGGLIDGEPVYLIGEPASKCDNDTFNSVYYKGLCQKINYRITEMVKPPIESYSALATYIGFFLFYIFIMYYLWLAQRYKRVRKIATATGKLMPVNEKDYVISDY